MPIEALDQVKQADHPLILQGRQFRKAGGRDPTPRRQEIDRFQGGELRPNWLPIAGRRAHLPMVRAQGLAGSRKLHLIGRSRGVLCLQGRCQGPIARCINH